MGKLNGMDPKLVRQMLTDLEHRAKRIQALDAKITQLMSTAGVPAPVPKRPAQLADLGLDLVRDVRARLAVLEKQERLRLNPPAPPRRTTPKPAVTPQRRTPPPMKNGRGTRQGAAPPRKPQTPRRQPQMPSPAEPPPATPKPKTEPELPRHAVPPMEPGPGGDVLPLAEGPAGRKVGEIAPQGPGAEPPAPPAQDRPAGMGPQTAGSAEGGAGGRAPQGGPVLPEPSDPSGSGRSGGVPAPSDPAVAEPPVREVGLESPPGGSEPPGSTAPGMPVAGEGRAPQDGPVFPEPSDSSGSDQRAGVPAPSDPGVAEPPVREVGMESPPGGSEPPGSTAPGSPVAGEGRAPQGGPVPVETPDPSRLRQDADGSTPADPGQGGAGRRPYDPIVTETTPARPEGTQGGATPRGSGPWSGYADGPPGTVEPQGPAEQEGR
ncbi:hypothetical protein [Rhizohabitans arisaemae]|uniref:hypothetical protein n=1 Tax=Rhizohabitans arisaemae TaxID=2720610 RepID=UPI0024B1D068|nr:hypothetical protein [Rhizohabitans arisaemae]